LEQLVSVRQAGADVLDGEAGIVVEDLLVRPACREQADDELDRQPRALDDRLADENGGIGWRWSASTATAPGRPWTTR
jgi:hypothetical protein